MYLRKKDLARRGIVFEESNDTIHIRFDAHWDKDTIRHYDKLMDNLGASMQDRDSISVMICDTLLVTELKKLSF